MKKHSDVKFIIYQVLYIFVVCVIALKGANIDLSEVISKEKVVEKSYADSLKAFLDSLIKLGLVPEIKFDTNRKFENIEELRQQLAQMKQQLVVVQTNPNFQVDQTRPNIEVQKEKEEKTPEEKKEENLDDISPLKVQTLTQYTSNTISNRGNQTLDLVGSDGSVIASIPPGGTKTFTLGGQTSVTYRMGNQSKTGATKENQKPKVSLQRLAATGENVSVRSIQSTVGYRVSITDDYPGQLEVKFTGPVTVKQSGDNTYDITLNFLGSKSSYDNFTDNKDAPYTVSFQVIVKDKIAGHSLTQTGVFQFGEW